MISLTLPYPVSSNRYWRSFVPKGWTRAVVALSPEAKSYKSEVGWIAKAAGVHTPMRGPLEVDLQLVPINRRRVDIDNALKVAIDALNGIAFDDDSQIIRLTAEVMDADGKGALLVRVSAFEPRPAAIFAQQQAA